MYTITIEDQQ